MSLNAALKRQWRAQEKSDKTAYVREMNARLKIEPRYVLLNGEGSVVKDGVTTTIKAALTIPQVRVGKWKLVPEDYLKC